MQSKLIPLTLEVPHAFIYAILDRAEGASNYWARIDVNSWTEEDENECRYPRVITLTEFGDEAEPVSEARLSVDEIATGIRRVLLNDMVKDGKMVKASHALCSENTRADLFKALCDDKAGTLNMCDWTVDAVIQAAALGRIVYG